MDLQVWSKVGEKRGVVLALRGDEVHRIEVTGNKVSQEVPRIIEALQRGQEPARVGANSVQTIPLASIAQTRVSPGQDDVEFRAGGENGTKLSFSIGDNKAGEIAWAVLARTGRSFREEKQDITAVEAVLPPMIVGAIIGFFWAMFYLTAGDIESGKEVNTTGRRGLQKQLIAQVAGMLGVNGLLILGAVLLLWILGWATMRVVRRPQRTVWQAEATA
jgi:hypothetical protein